MNGYICFYKGKRLEVLADTSYEAQEEAAKIFHARKSSDVVTMLAEKDGVPVIHSGGELS